MSFLLDTNVVSEWAKERPDTGVISWLADVDEDRVFISVVTLAELRHGIERLPGGKRRTQLEDWLQADLRLRFEGRVLPIDEPTADAWGLIVATHDRAAKPIGVMDAFLAATAQVHTLTLVTRNTGDFESSVKSVLNPWSNG